MDVTRELEGLHQLAGQAQKLADALPARTSRPLTSEEQVRALQELRLRIAALSETLAQRELAGRVLRLTLETKKRAAGATKTDAERDAKVDELYLAHERYSIQLTYDRAVLEAEAEAARFGLQLRVADLALGVE